MDTNIIYRHNTNFINSLKFKLPINASITDLKISNINIFSKVLSKGRIAIYGNYQILALYSLFLTNSKFKNTSICRRTNFYKVLKLNTSLKDSNISNIKAEINFTEKPNCLYSVYSNNNSKCYLGFTNFCKVYLISSLSITLLKKHKTKKNLIKSSKVISEEHSIHIEKNKLQRFIEATSIIGNGSIDFFLEKTLDITATTPPIWMIDKIKTDISINNLSLLGDNAIVTGSIDVNINYKTLISSPDDTTTGNLNYLQSTIPFSSQIQLNLHDNITIKKSDKLRVVKAICLGENHKLSNPLNLSSNEIVYRKITEQLVMQISVIVTRKEKIII